MDGWMDRSLGCVEGGSLGRKTNNKRPVVNHDDDDHEDTILHDTMDGSVVLLVLLE